MSEQTINILSKTTRNDNKSILFFTPEEYMKIRKGKFILGFFRRWFETRAIDRCLKGFDDIHSVCDVPCGPGILFSYWYKKGYRVIAADISGQMIEAANKKFKQLNLEGRVIKYNAFDIKGILQENEVDLIAIATHGRSGLGRAIIGSVADYVVRQSGIPILLIRPSKSQVGK